MKHLSDGTIRRIIDEPFASGPRDRAHLGECPACRSRIEDIRDDQAFVATAFTAPVSQPDLAAARAAIAGRRPSRRKPFAGGFPIRKPGLIPGIASLVLAGGLIASAATGAMGSLLTVFQPTTVTPIFLERGTLSNLPQLRHLGNLVPPGNVATREYQSLSAAERASGLKILLPRSLPAGVPSNRQTGVMAAQTSSFTFSASKAAAYARSSHRRIPPIPDDLNGATLTLTTNPAVVTVYGGRADIPDLVVAETRAPALTMSGAPLQTVESYLSKIPGIPRSLVTQLKSLSKPTSTLPIPIPLNLAYASHVTINDAPGLLIGDNTGVASVVVWEKGGVVYGVGGGLTSTQVVKTAESLR